MHVRLQLDLPADAALLPKTRWALAGYMEELGTGSEIMGDVILALDEACANVVRHAFPDGTGEYRLVADLSSDELIFEVPDAEVAATLPVVQHVMQDAPFPAVLLSVPLHVDARAATNWDEAH